MPSNDDAASNSPTPRIAKATKRAVVLRSEALEETLIPAEVPVLPIARQMRQLTTYELAEIEFRKGVANLRHGRIKDAEAQFRLANEEDRSHVAARQALIGILIEAGRNADAEDVLSESLSINPRQPREAMVLARLQVERGDFDAAIRTLESVSAYAGADAGYYSLLAAVFQRASRHEEAAKQYRNALALMPRNAIWLMGLGISLRALGESNQAQDAFKRAASTGTLSSELQAYVVKQYTELHFAAK
jgi:MSHA biogenesis protein MshN